jgi:hypothetical protein
MDARTRPDGTLPKKVALAAFETAIGPIPGVDVKPLPVKGLVEGTRALNAVLFDVWDQLTLVQQRAVQELLAGSDARVVPESGAAGSSGPVGGTSRRAGLSDAEVSAGLNDARIDIEAHLGRPLGVPLQFSIVDFGTTARERQALAQTLTNKADGTPVVAGDPSASEVNCEVQIRPSTLEESVEDLKGLFAHEVFHCFQFLYGGGLSGDAIRDMPDWVFEGQPSWVGESIGDGTSLSEQWWQKWLSVTLDGLFTRSYDAIGFYSDLDANGIDPWSIFDAQLAAGSDDLAAYNAAVGVDGTDFLEVVAKALVRHRRLGDSWESTGPGITDHSGFTIMDVNPESTDSADDTRTEGACGGGCAGRATIEQDVTLDPFSTAPYQLNIAGDVLQLVTTAGHATVGFEGGDEMDLQEGRIESFCLLPGGCTCEDGSEPLGGAPLTEATPGTAGVALASEHAGTFTIAAAAMTMDQACAEGTGMDRCLLGTWVLDIPSLSETLQERLGDTGAEVQALGHGTLTFHASNYESDLDLTLLAKNEIRGVGPVEAEVTIKGAGQARYTADGLGISQEGVDTTFDVGVSVNVSGRTVTNVPIAIPGAGDFGEDLFTESFYTCPDPSHLVMTPRDGYPVPFIRQE